MTRFSILLGTLVMLFAGACISPVEVDFAEAEQELVVYSHFGVDEPIKIYLTHTRDPLKPNQLFKPVENATIKVYQNGELVSNINRSSEPDKKIDYAALYNTEVHAVGGSRYQIEVIAEGYKNARSVETIPHHKATIQSFESIESNDENKLYRLLFSDDNTENYYYQLAITALEHNTQDSLIREEAVDYDLVIRSSAYTHFESDMRAWTAVYPEYAGFLFTGVNEEGGVKELFIKIPNEDRSNEMYNYTYKIELHKVSDAYFLYHQSIQAQFSDDNILSNPTQIYNNIEGGFGNFSAYNAATIEVSTLRVGE